MPVGPAIVLLMAAAPARAEGEPARGASKQGGLLGLWNVETMIDATCTNIARHYNLTREQDEYTRKLMAERVKRFLDKHEADLRGLLGELLRLQLKREAPSPELARRLGEEALPIFEDARREILEANRQWRRILTDEQKRIHDEDLKRMKANFERLEEQFTRWKQGQFDPRSGSLAAALRPPSAPIRRLPTSRPLASSLGPTPALYSPYHYWDRYVKNFINIYKLDEAQRQTALAILKDCKERAIQYRETHKQELEQAAGRIRELIRSRADRQEIRQAIAAQRKLTQPITDIFRELQRRLNEIPTDAQRQRYAGGYARRWDQVRYYRPGSASTTKPAPRTSRPSGSAAASAPTTMP